MEELRSLAWTHISTSAPAISMSVSDLTTDLSNDPATDDGPGLLRSPAGTLTSNVDGYVDYLDATGRWVGRGSSVPATAVYTLGRAATCERPGQSSGVRRGGRNARIHFVAVGGLHPSC